MSGPGPTEWGVAAGGVGPWAGPLPDDPRYDPALLRDGDTRNVVDAYRYWTREAIVADIDNRRHALHVAIENFGNDANIGGVVRTANAFALKRRLDPHRENHVPFYCGGIPEWPGLRQELAELRNPTMEHEEGQVKQILEDKEALAARLHRSPDLLDALLMTFTFSDQG